MKKFRIVLYVVFLSYLAVTIYMGLNVDKMISRFGLLSFFSFLQNWLASGNLYIIILLIVENIHIFLLKQRVKSAENERDDLIIRVNDLRKQIINLKREKE